MKRQALIDARKRAKLTQEVVAERMEVSTAQISRWENGHDGIPSQRLDAMARAYEASIGEIFEGETLPTETELEQMIQLAMGELPVGVTFEDYPRAVASSLHDQLRQFQAAGGSRRTSDEAISPDKGALSRRSTKPSAQV